MAHRASRMKLLLTAVLTLCATPAWAQTQSAPALVNAITVSGEAEEQVAPDRAVISLSVVTRNPDVNVAKAENDAVLQRVAAIADNFRIPRENLATSNAQVAPEYTYEGGKQQFSGYMMNRSLRLTIDNLPIYEQVLSSLVENRVEQINGVEFLLADREARARDVRVRAVENARQKALALAQAAGARLGQVISITTADIADAGRPMPFAQANVKAAPSLPGLITLKESVTVSFALQ